MYNFISFLMILWLIFIFKILRGQTHPYRKPPRIYYSLRIRWVCKNGKYYGWNIKNCWAWLKISSCAKVKVSKKLIFGWSVSHARGVWVLCFLPFLSCVRGTHLCVWGAWCRPDALQATYNFALVMWRHDLGVCLGFWISI